MVRCYFQRQKQIFKPTCLQNIENFIIFATLWLKVYPLHDVIIFELKSLITRKQQGQFTKYFTCCLLATLAIFGRNFIMGGLCTLSSAEVFQLRARECKQNQIYAMVKGLVS